MAARTKKTLASQPLRPRLICPHCGNSFPPGDILWLAEHPSLVGDPLLDAGEQNRFLPTRFDIDGNAIDVKGVTCREVACPKCHLVIPRALVELEPVFISTLGAPSSGKSYFIAAMIQETQQAALRHFETNLADVDPVGNEVINDYINRLFRNGQPDDLVALEKTEQTGRQYNSVKFDERPMHLPKPFVYAFQPLKLQDERERRKLCRAVCLYDNAGEHYMPGKTESMIATQHMAHSKVLMFLFDPLQHAGFRKHCAGRTEDPQLGKLGKNNPQDQVLLEAARRVRSLTGLSQYTKIARPLVVVLTKYDVWYSLLADGFVEINTLLLRTRSGTVLDQKRIQALSDRLRRLLAQLAPDIVAAAEGFSDEVLYLPNSALGCSPELVPGGKGLGVRPRNIQPRLAELPLLYALHRAVPTLIPAVDRSQIEGAASFVPISPAPKPASGPRTTSVSTTETQQFETDDSDAPSMPAENADPPVRPKPLPREVSLMEPTSLPAPKIDNYLKEADS